MISRKRPAPPPIDKALIDKYSGRGPRYTSYPTAPEWNESVGADDFWRHIEKTNRDAAAPLSLYLHIPFCEERCSFCACNVIITPHKRISDEYVELVSLEIDLIAERIHPERRVVQFHIGGGTPTHTNPESLDRLLEHLMNRFRFVADAERSIEVDSRVTKDAHLDVLRRHGFNRISLGVQDATSRTQEAINRVQDLGETHEFIQRCREKGFKSVNIDLVYGLPYQTRVTFDRTIDAVYTLNPDRIAFYNYAYLPQRLAHQRRIDEKSLPDAEERFAIFRRAIEELTALGYIYIGMDHFAKPDDELTIAQQMGTLQRNFMGFTTRAGADLYAFGVSSISSLPGIYTQNIKRLHTYQRLVTAGELPIERGIELSKDDRMRRWLIMELMCNLRVDTRRFEETWNEDFHRYFYDEIVRLKPYIDDGLVDPNIAREIRITDLGRVIIRPICMVFDRYLTEAAQTGRSLPTFSKTL